MKNNFADILALTDQEPKWYDENGTPRFAEFSPELCPNIYADTVFLMYIQCQYCQRGFYVEMHSTVFSPLPRHPKHLHYGDPPPHGCVGDTMNCMDIRIVQAWRRLPIEKVVESLGDEVWERVKELEVAMDDAGWTEREED